MSGLWNETKAWEQGNTGLLKVLVQNRRRGHPCRAAGPWQGGLCGQTVVGNCCSAGRLYDKIGNTTTAKVKYVLANAVVCKVKVPLGAEPAEDGEEDISF